MSRSVEEIRSLMELFSSLQLGEMKLEEEGFSLKFCAAAGSAVRAPAAAAEVLPTVSAFPAPAPAAQERAGSIVYSPIVGTFYAAPAPDAAPFVKIGSRVGKGDVILIIESMKLMNEVTSEFEGTIAEILVNSGDPVEYGQPLMRIE